METTFLSCDWGTSSFRLRLVEAFSLRVIAEVHSEEGIARVYESWQLHGYCENDRWGYYLVVLCKYISQLEKQLNISLKGSAIVISGMASSSIGMKELPYKHLPFPITDINLVTEIIKTMNEGDYEILLVSGASTGTDVMRGEETQLLGCSIKSIPGKQLFVFPGTHSKHILVEDGKVADFKTYMTGEFFDLLSTNSILSKSITSGSSLDNPGIKQAFANGVLESQDHSLLHTSFKVRTNDLFNRFSKEMNYWYLSGLVIGAELTALLNQPFTAVTLVSEGKLLQLYENAIRTLGSEMHFQSMDVNEAILKAHQKIYLSYYPQ